MIIDANQRQPAPCGCLPHRIFVIGLDDKAIDGVIGVDTAKGELTMHAGALNNCHANFRVTVEAPFRLTCRAHGEHPQW